MSVAVNQLKQFNQVALTVFLACLLGGLAVARFTNSPIAWIAGLLIGIYFLFAIKVIDQWEKVAVLRFGKYRALRGPGLVVIIPILDTLSRYVDQRVRVSTVFAESTLTRDTVPVSVDAIFFWLVWNAEKSILEVENFTEAITLSAQTALRESIGRHDLAQMVAERDLMGHELQKILDEKMTPWGITVQSVEIRDVRIPPSLENAMSQQAQAERERQARIILGDAEVQVSEKFAEASRVYAGNPGALHLRGMNMLYEAMRDKGSMVIVEASSAIDFRWASAARWPPPPSPSSSRVTRVPHDSGGVLSRAYRGVRLPSSSAVTQPVCAKSLTPSPSSQPSPQSSCFSRDPSMRKPRNPSRSTWSQPLRTRPCDGHLSHGER